MQFNIDRWNKRNNAAGFVATFDAKLEGGVTIRRLGLVRPKTSSDHLWLHIPTLEIGGRQSVSMPNALRDAIGQRAVEMFNVAAGTGLRYAPPPRREDVGHDVEDSLQMAGIDA